jgi:hypothetical protein
MLHLLTYCDMITWSVVRQRLGKHISATADRQQSKTVFSVWSMPRLYSEDDEKSWLCASRRQLRQ